MDVQPRVWPPTEITLSTSHHHHHEQQLQQQHPNQPHNPSLYPQPQDMTTEHQHKRQRLYDEQDDRYPHNPAHAPMASSSTLPHHQGPQGNPYPPPSDEPHPEPGVMDEHLKHEPYAPNAAELYNHAQAVRNSSSPGPSSDSGSGGGVGGNHYAGGASLPPRLPPILQVEKQQVTTTATQAASASRRRNEAHFVCPVPGCGSTFTRRFNLRGHLRSHTEERPYVCEVCKKGFARQHDCKRHQALHATLVKGNICQGCKKPFSRLDALNRHLRSEGGAECRHTMARQKAGSEAAQKVGDPQR